MDTSETYIKMCEKAEEITVNHEWEAGDFGFWPGNGDINVMYMGEYTPAELGEGHLWLPRQDQLQEMVEHGYGTTNDWLFTTLHNVTSWAFREKFVEWIPTSMEQLWLAFIMKEKYNKIWDGGDWVTTK